MVARYQLAGKEGWVMNQEIGVPNKRRLVVAGWAVDAIVVLGFAGLVASILGIGFLNSGNWPTGGDAASHLLYAWLYAEGLLFSGQVVPWVPEVFGGLPFLSYYFPLPFIVIALLSKALGLASAFKWGSFLAAMLLPGLVFVTSRRWLAFSWPAALFGALGALMFLLHEQNSIWGGNLLSTLSGEFAYSYGVLFAVLAMMAWARAIHLGRGWILAALMEAASGFSHGFPLLVVGFSTAFLLLDGLANGRLQDRLNHFKKSIGMLACGHLLAFALLGGWLWPMLEMHGLTIPNDGSFPIGGWRDLLPETLWPAVGGGLLGLALLAFPSVRRGWSKGQRLALCYFISGAGLSAVAFIAGDQLGLADVRFFPMVWLLGAIGCGWLLGQGLSSFVEPSNAKAMVLAGAYRFLFVAAACFGLLGWLGQHVQRAPDWGLWNHSGLDAKPQWHNLSTLFPAMKGDLWSPRLVFEHDPENNDLGSTRSLEALPMFLNHRPVLEGLYMESALLGPAVYQVQSEVSARPSSPLGRFPSGSLDPQFAALHMNFLHADTLLLRSTRAKNEIEASRLFEKIAESAPFSLYRLKQFDSHLAQVVTQPLRARPAQDWMQDSFAWFRTRSRFNAYLPVFVDGKIGDDAVPRNDNKLTTGAAIRERSLSRNELIFETEALGKAHLIKVAYHPRWQLESKGRLQIAGPGFMLVTPEEKEIRLVYGHTLVGKLGIAATSAAFLFFLVFLWKKLTSPAATGALPAATDAGLRYWIPIFAGWLFLALAGYYFRAHSPEPVYTRAWASMNANQHKEASALFLRAYQLRRPPAKKEEALFWLAKSTELGGQRAQAKARYRELIDHFHGFWVPEALYTYILFERQDGHRPEVEQYVRRLREEYPNNQWTLKLDQAQ
jgi:tetratricopeptide (TPR) repeat protein